jgi:hypothetical protein
MIIPYAQECRNQASRLTALFQRSIQTITGTFQESRFLYHVGGKFRRFRLAHFQKAYVLEQQSARQGACRQCGTCCNLLFTCPRLTKASNCLAYGTCRPDVCKLFPIDQRDIREVEMCGGKCGFYFTTSASSNRLWSEARESSDASPCEQPNRILYFRKSRRTFSPANEEFQHNGRELKDRLHHHKSAE